MKMMKSPKAVAAAALIACSSSFAGMQTGDTEVGVFMYMVDSDAATTTTLQTNFGYVFVDNIQGQFRFGVSGTEISGGADQTQTNLGFGVNYLFGDANSEVLPYVGVGFDMFEPSVGDGTDYVTLQVGAKFFVSERVSFDLNLQSQSGDGPSGESVDQTIMMAGVNLYF